MAMVFLREHSVHQQEVDVFRGVFWLAADGLELHIKGCGRCTVLGQYIFKTKKQASPTTVHTSQASAVSIPNSPRPGLQRSLEFAMRPLGNLRLIYLLT